MAANPDLKGQVSKFKVGGISDNPNRLVDVLSEQISIQKEIEREASGSKGVDNDAAYKAIEEAYSQLKDQLLVAVGISQ